MPFIYFTYLTLFCWLGFAIYWVISGIDVKETAEQQSIGQRISVMAFMFVGFFLLGYTKLPPSLARIIIPHTQLFGYLAAASSIAGLAICIWARRTLGRNWSAQVTFKQNHELITRGPYQYMRHPIYTGFGLLFLGTALALGHVGAFVGLLVIMIGFIFKYKQEEQLMLKHFPDKYPGYMQRVKALIPFIF